MYDKKRRELVEFKGRLVRWNDDRGFGFIKISSSEKDVFIHITALKDMPRRPIVGDIIYFQVEHGEDGKASAKSARIEGLAKISRKTRPKKDGNEYLFIFVFAFFALVLAAFLSYYIYTSSIFEEEDFTGIFEEFTGIFEEEDFTGYQCEGKQYCSQMTCKEARFYLKNCPNVKIDGDFDGIPCEQQCNW